MKLTLAALAAVLLIFLLFVVARLALVFGSSGPPRTVISTTRVENKTLVCTLTLQSDRSMTVVELDAPRAQAFALGMQPPEGFTEQRLAAEAITGGASSEEVQTVRYVGSFQLEPGIPKELRIPITTDGSKPLTLQGQIEGKWGAGGTMSFFRIEHQARTESPAINHVSGNPFKPNPLRSNKRK